MDAGPHGTTLNRYEERFERNRRKCSAGTVRYVVVVRPYQLPLKQGCSPASTEGLDERRRRTERTTYTLEIEHGTRTRQPTLATRRLLVAASVPSCSSHGPSFRLVLSLVRSLLSVSVYVRPSLPGLPAVLQKARRSPVTVVIHCRPHAPLPCSVARGHLAAYGSSGSAHLAPRWRFGSTASRMKRAR